VTFFDKKEEVMKIELTPYGRYLLSMGKLKPKYYRFFDDNVLYDSKCGGFDEERNQTGNRIENETPLLKGNPNITGVETNIRKMETPEATGGKIRVQILDDHINGMPHSLGTSNYLSKYKPSTKIDLFRGAFIPNRISGSYSSKNISSAVIPQIPLKIFFTGSIKGTTLNDDATDVNSFDSKIFNDGTYFNVKYAPPILRLSEVSGFDEKENFILTAYKVYHDKGTGINTYHKLRTGEQESRIINNILLSDEEIIQYGGNVPVENSVIDKNHLGYYIGLDFDRTIPANEICSTIGELKIRNIYLDERIECPDMAESDTGFLDIYGSRVTPDDLEDC